MNPNPYDPGDDYYPLRHYSAAEYVCGYLTMMIIGLSMACLFVPGGG